ncbi:MAG: L-aspartate oxidase, partial [Gammaproteobacteria bacterium]|nr:L-aspartate oxidase [Gammaproteobacteria bacterium]
KAVHGTLQSAVRHHPNITIYEHHLAVDLIRREGRVVGAYVYDEVQKKVKVFASRAVLLATGGASRAYLYSTNPAVSSGDGIAMAHRAGAKTQDLEFNQFHPTCLYHPHAGSFLISEAVRGEGGKLILPDGTRFMPQFDPRAELAPRDIVARAIDFEMKRLGLDCVYLDIRHRGKAFIVSHFPNIYARCLDLGIDITTEPIPVVPAAHYTCGGVVVDEHARTTIRGLYAAGEAARTGLHGANRLASNSLLECMVYGKAAAFDIRASLPAWPLIRDLPAWDESQVSDSNEAVLITQNWDELRRMMWSYVGIVRSQKRLARARARIELLKREVQEYYGHFRVTRDLLELRNLVVVADLIIQACLERPESIGLHYMV